MVVGEHRFQDSAHEPDPDVGLGKIPTTREGRLISSLTRFERAG